VSIGGIANAQYIYSSHLFIVVLVLTIFALIVGAAAHFLGSGQRQYDVNKKKKTGKSGKENNAYAKAEEGKSSNG